MSKSSENHSRHLKKWNTERISEAVKSAETRTSGEIVPLITRSLDSYFEIDALGFLAGISLSSLILLFVPHSLHWELSIEKILLIQALSACAGLGLVKIPTLRRSLLGRQFLDSKLKQAVQSAFIELGVTETKERTGVLILIAEFEHRVAILADQGIHQKVPAGFWDDEVRALTQGIRENRSTEALCQVIQQIGDKLAASFPRRAEDRNELPDAPIHRNP